MTDINQLINNAEIQNAFVLAKILNVSSQQINKWRSRGVSKGGAKKIESNETLRRLDKKNLITESIVKKNQQKAINFIENLDLNKVSKKTGVSLMCLLVYKSRGAVTMNLARQLRDKMKIPTSTSRPDIPQIAFDVGVKHWSTPIKQKQYKAK
jgi:hypothetical protein